MVTLEQLVTQLTNPLVLSDILCGNSPEWMLERALKNSTISEVTIKLNAHPYLLSPLAFEIATIRANDNDNNAFQLATIIAIVGAITNLNAPSALIEIEQLQPLFPSGNNSFVPEIIQYALQILRERVEQSSDLYPSKEMAVGGEYSDPKASDNVATETLIQNAPESTSESKVITVDFTARARTRS